LGASLAGFDAWDALRTTAAGVSFGVDAAFLARRGGASVLGVCGASFIGSLPASSSCELIKFIIDFDIGSSLTMSSRTMSASSDVIARIYFEVFFTCQESMPLAGEKKISDCIII
jgi:hypothetical protein